MKKMYLSIWTLFVLIGCSVNKAPGIYKYQGQLKISSSQLILKDNGAFEYSFQAGDAYKLNVNGKWRLSGNKKDIILNSEIQSASDLIYVEEIKNPNLVNEAKISIYDSANNPFFAWIKINPVESGITFYDSDYVVNTKTYPHKNIRQVALNYLGLNLNSKYILYKVKSENSNEFIIHLKLPPSTRYRFFKDEIWHLKNKKLIIVDTLMKPAKKLIYHKYVSSK